MVPGVLLISSAASSDRIVISRELVLPDYCNCYQILARHFHTPMLLGTNHRV